jgi:hypothetical protein
MNILEHFERNKETFDDIYDGIVEDVVDPDNLKRARIRVMGIFDSPIKTEHIPWARPLVKQAVPRVGTYCKVLFLRGDLMFPMYFAPEFIGKFDRATLETEIQSILESKKSFQGVDCGGASFDEPVPPIDGAPNKDRDSQLTRNTDENSDSAILEDKNLQSGKEHYSLTHPSGSYIDISKDGHVVIHSSADIFNVSESNNNGLVRGDLNLRVEGSINIKVGANEIKITQTGLEITSPQAQIKGASLQIDGTSLPDPTGKGPFCGLPSCLFTGSPHTGNKSLNN